MTDPRARADEQLRLLDEALRFARVGLYRYRFDGTLLEMNDAAFDILELKNHFGSPEEVVGRNIAELLRYVGPPGKVRELIRKYGEARDVLYPFRTLDGVDKWAVHDSFAVVDPATGEKIVQAIIKDVTDFHRTEEALRASEERLTRIVETIAEGIVLLDTTGRCTFANATAERILGLSRAEIVGRSFNTPEWKITTVAGEPFPEEELPFARVMRTGESVHEVEHAVTRPNGTRVLLSINAAPLQDAAGTLVGVVASLTDITERRRLEELRDEFLATAAHELKTPTTAIQGYAQLLRKWAPEGHNPREGRAFEMIATQSERLNRRIREMLEIVRFRAPHPALNRELFDLGNLASGVVGRIKTERQLPHLALKREALTPVEADRQQIERVIESLLENAIHSSGQGGNIDVRVWAQEGNAMVSVRSPGPGIPRQRQVHLFEPFYQGMPPGSTGYQSEAALGLYLDRLIIEHEGGRIWFQSEEGRESIFYFSLPLAQRRHARADIGRQDYERMRRNQQ